MNPSKPWYASAGVWGALVTLAGSLLALLKVELDPVLLDDVRDWVLQLATLIGGAVALWGRVRASRRIGPAPDVPPHRPMRPPNGRRMLLLMLIVGGALLASAPRRAAPNPRPVASLAADQTTLAAAQSTVAINRRGQP